jgi:hypothetical protein
MALQTNLFISESVVDQSRPSCHPPGWQGRSMRIVAITAIDGTLIDRMLERHREVRACVPMAPETKLRLAFCEQESGRNGFMD